MQRLNRRDTIKHLALGTVAGLAVPPCLAAEPDPATTRKTEIWPAVDVLVCGGGPAGIAAAMMAGRQGARVLLAERYGRLGGMAVQAMVGPLMGDVESTWVKQIIDGLGGRKVDYEFADLKGDETRAAISMMNGIPNSPLEGYLQVKDAVVAFNTLVNGKWNMAIGLGDKKNNVVLPPKDCAVANNLFLVTKGQLLDQQTEPQEYLWQGNLVEAAGPIPETVGRRVSDLRFRQSAGGIWRPSADSPVVGAAQGEFPFVTEDIDGHARSEPKDAGCDRIATPAIKAGPLLAGDVGISWETIKTED